MFRLYLLSLCAFVIWGVVGDYLGLLGWQFREAEGEAVGRGEEDEAVRGLVYGGGSVVFPCEEVRGVETEFPAYQHCGDTHCHAQVELHAGHHAHPAVSIAVDHHVHAHPAAVIGAYQLREYLLLSSDYSHKAVNVGQLRKPGLKIGLWSHDVAAIHAPCLGREYRQTAKLHLRAVAVEECGKIRYFVESAFHHHASLPVDYSLGTAPESLLVERAGTEHPPAAARPRRFDVASWMTALHPDDGIGICRFERKHPIAPEPREDFHRHTPVAERAHTPDDRIVGQNILTDAYSDKLAPGIKAPAPGHSLRRASHLHATPGNLSLQPESHRELRRLCAESVGSNHDVASVGPPHRQKRSGIMDGLSVGRGGVVSAAERERKVIFGIEKMDFHCGSRLDESFVGAKIDITRVN